RAYLKIVFGKYRKNSPEKIPSCSFIFYSILCVHVLSRQETAFHRSHIGVFRLSSASPAFYAHACFRGCLFSCIGITVSSSIFRALPHSLVFQAERTYSSYNSQRPAG